MKKSFLLLGFLSGATTLAQAQSAIPAGTVSLGGGIGYNRTTEEASYSTGGSNYSYESTNSTFQFTPSVGYFVADNLAIGLGLGYMSTGTSTEVKPKPAYQLDDLDPSTNLRLGAYVQYYKMLTDQFGVAGTLGAGYQKYKQVSYDNNNGSAVEDKASGFYTELTPSVVFFPVPKFAISASIGSLGYNRLNREIPDDLGAPDNYEQSLSTFSANFGFDQLLFGGTYYFGR